MEEFVCKLIEGEHYNLEVCNVSGCDWVPFIQNEVDDWLSENMKDQYKYAGASRYIDQATNYKNVRIVFKNEEHAMAFKLRWT